MEYSPQAADRALRAASKCQSLASLLEVLSFIPLDNFNGVRWNVMTLEEREVAQATPRLHATKSRLYRGVHRPPRAGLAPVPGAPERQTDVRLPFLT